MPKTDAGPWTLELHSDLAAFTRQEDGSQYTYAVFFVIAENERGQRFAHQFEFHSAEQKQGEEFDYIVSHLEETRERAQRFLERVLASQKSGAWTTPVDSPYWHETHPVYGSPAYLERSLDYVNEEREAEGEQPLPF